MKNINRLALALVLSMGASTLLGSYMALETKDARNARQHQKNLADSLAKGGKIAPAGMKKANDENLKHVKITHAAIMKSEGINENLTNINAEKFGNYKAKVNSLKSNVKTDKDAVKWLEGQITAAEEALSTNNMRSQVQARTSGEAVGRAEGFSRGRVEGAAAEHKQLFERELKAGVKTMERQGQVRREGFTEGRDSVLIDIARSNIEISFADTKKKVESAFSVQEIRDYIRTFELECDVVIQEVSKQGMSSQGLATLKTWIGSKLDALRKFRMGESVGESEEERELVPLESLAPKSPLPIESSPDAEHVSQSASPSAPIAVSSPAVPQQVKPKPSPQPEQKSAKSEIQKLDEMIKKLLSGVQDKTAAGHLIEFMNDTRENAHQLTAESAKRQAAAGIKKDVNQAKLAIDASILDQILALEAELYIKSGSSPVDPLQL